MGRLALLRLVGPVAGLIITMAAGGCASHGRSRPDAGSTADAEYRKLADEYFAAYLGWRPSAGTGMGLHEYDGRVTDVSRASINAERERLGRFHDRLEAVVHE